MNAMRKERWAATLNSFSLVFPRDPPKIGLVSSCHEVRDSDRAVLGGDRGSPMAGCASRRDSSIWMRDSRPKTGASHRASAFLGEDTEPRRP